MAKEFEDKRKDNLRVLVDILVQGHHVPAGAVIPKAAMSKADWQNLAFAFDPPRVVETSDREQDAEYDADAATAATMLPAAK